MRQFELLKVIDEFLCFVYIHRVLKPGDVAALHEHVVAPYHAAHGVPDWTGSAIEAESANHPTCYDILRP